MSRPVTGLADTRARAAGLRRAALGLMLLCSAAIIGCGGGEGAIEGAASREAAQAAPNLVFGVDGAGVVTLGSFERAPSYLSYSPRVLLGKGQVSVATPVAKRGHYEVFTWRPQPEAELGDAKVTVHHFGGRTVRSIDQSPSGGEWLSLGIFEFSGNAGRVVFEGTHGARLVVDAVRLQWVGEQRPLLDLRADTLSVGMKDQPYHSSLTVIGGTGPFEFQVSRGALPPGLDLASDRPVLSGIAAMSGRFGFEVTLRDASGAVVKRELEIVIDDSAGDEAAAQGMAPMSRGSTRERPQGTSANTADLSGLINQIAAMPDGSWSRLNLNSFSDVWAPADLRPLFDAGNPTPSKIMLAWSSFAWDSNRAALLLYGGGHANYSGNDVYLWRASSRMWERAALPSQVIRDALGNRIAIDGASRAPTSAHTYDNTLFLPRMDRMLVLGGAADSNGGHFLIADTATTSRRTGPYLFDPSRAHPDRVGGSTGSHVQRVAPYPAIAGGNMWANRENWLNASASSTPPNESLANGCTGYAEEGGLDVVYVRTASRLYRYRILDVGNAAADRWEIVGRYFGGSGTQATCSYDTQRKVFVTTNRNTSSPFAYWDLNTPGKSNNESYFRPTEASGEFAQLLASNAIDIRFCAIEFDTRRAHHKLWCGDGRVWTLTPPATLSTSGWTISRDAASPSAVPNGNVGVGILGKWKYIPNLDVFMGLQDAVLGNVWIYKPSDWSSPAAGNLLPSVAVVAPAGGTSFELGAPIALAASASDTDGSVTQVEFYANGNKVGESMAPPYAAVWTGAALGNWALTAVATDNLGAKRTSSPVAVLVQPTLQPNLPPSVSLTQPAPNTSVAAGTPILIAAHAADADGDIAKVEFFAGSTKIGEAVAAPYTLLWPAAPSGATSISAIARDDRGATANSAAVAISVTPVARGASTVTLQRGSSSGAVVSDLYLSSYHKTLNFGTASTVQHRLEYYSPLLRFAIFQSEGGPVPNGAVIHSAVLSIYKYSSYDASYAVHSLLQDCSEGTATWNQRATGQPWATAGANGAGSDFAVVADAAAATAWDPEWIAFDVTAAVARWSDTANGSNFGWRLKTINSYNNLKRMHSSDYAADPSLRPKLVIRFE